MSEAATLEATPETIVSTPPDDGVVNPPADAVGEAPAEDKPADGLEPQPEDAAPATPAPRTVSEIEAAIRDPAATVTGAELETYRRYQQAVETTRARIDTQRAQFTTAVTAAKDLVYSHAEKEILAAAAADREPDLEHIKERMGTVFETLQSKAEVAATAALDADVDAWLFEAYGGPTAGYEQATKGQNLRQKMQTQLELAYSMGQRAGPDASSIVLTQSELDAKIQAAVNASRAATPSRGASVGGNATPSTLSREAEDAKLLNPATPITEINAILARRNGQ